MDRPSQDQLTARLARLRADGVRIASAAVDAVSPGALVPQAWRSLDHEWRRHQLIHVLAAGKAAAGMLEAFLRVHPATPVQVLAVGPGRPDAWPTERPWVTGGHPLPTDGSLDGGLRALALAQGVPADGRLVLLLSGGASALMAAPAPGVTLAAKQLTVHTAMTAGADITALNAVRKHLSALKGGRLARACAGRTITLAISDVVGDDLGVIGSGPGVPDASTWADARDVLRRFGGTGHDAEVLARVEAGCRGEVPETPKPGDPSMARASAHVIGGRVQAMRAAAAEGRALGYEVIVHDPAITGEARLAAHAWWAETGARVGAPGRPVLVVSSGETTVRVRGPGRGGRNQEFALAAARPLADAPVAAALLSIGTDGVDGPTDAAGALVDGATLARAERAGLPAPDRVLDRNDTFPFFDALSDLVRTGPTGTNVGDLQLLLVAPGLIR